MDFGHSLHLAGSEVLLSLSGLALLLIAAWGGKGASRLVSILAVAALVGASVLALAQLAGPAPAAGIDAFYGQFRMDRFAAFTKLLIFGSAAIALMVAPRFFDRVNAMRPEYPVLVVFAAVGMGIMVSATDLLSLYIGLELNSLSAYVLAAFLRTDERSAESGLKYFVLGSLASGILLYGISLVYGFTGTTSFAGVSEALSGDLSNGALFGIIFVLSGLAFKISAVPFHMWTPDVYEGAPTPVTTLFATAPKVAAVALTMRVAIDAFGTQVDAWQQIVIFVALASIILGAVGAIGQTNLKRLLAYSSINNIGFILIGLAAATEAGLAAMLVYLVIYVAMTIGSFVVLLDLRDGAGVPQETMASISGLSKVRPGMAAALAIFMFALAGIPPLFGFWGKFVVFDAAVAAGLVPLAAIGIAASVIGAFYYLRVIKTMYFDEPSDVIAPRGAMENIVIVTIAALFVSPLGFLLARWLDAWAFVSAASLSAGS